MVNHMSNQSLPKSTGRASILDGLATDPIFVTELTNLYCLKISYKWVYPIGSQNDLQLLCQPVQSLSDQM